MNNKNNKKISKVNQKLIRVTISLDPNDYDAFDLIAKKLHLSRSWLIRKAMREFLDQNNAANSVDILK